MIEDDNEAIAVIKALRHFAESINEIVTLLNSGQRMTPEFKADLQALATTLKSELKAAAKHVPVNPYEYAYFTPAVTTASVNFRVAVNSHPIKSNWNDCLHGLSIDIGHLLSQLEKQYPTI